MASIAMLDPYTDAAGSPGPVETESRLSWSQIRQAVRKSHRMASSLLSRTPHTFTFKTVDSASGTESRLYFLGVQPGQRDNTLLYIDTQSHQDIDDMDLEDEHKIEIKPLLESFQTSSVPYGQLSKEEQLLRERKRLRSFGIMSYDFHEASGRFVFPACNSLFTCDDSVSQSGFSKEPLFPKEVHCSCSGSKLDPKLCPSNPEVLAFISASDIWVAHVAAGKDKRLTFAHNGAKSVSDDPKSAGVPSFVVQEEFDRYTGYWWQPGVHKTSDGKQMYRILYEEVDESDVQVLRIVSPQSDGTSVDEYRYPRAGTQNAKSTLRLLEFEIDESGAISDIRDLQLPEPLGTLFPWMEYLLRAGWTPDGKYAYTVMIDRAQQKLQIILLAPDCFCQLGDASNGENGEEPMNVTYLTDLWSHMHVIYEDTSDIWLHTHDLLHFFPQVSSQEISFVYASEKSEFLHLYHITASIGHSLDMSIGATKPQFEETLLTQGDWEVDSKQVWVDAKRKLVYFVGFQDSPLESHLYVVPMNHPNSIIRLSSVGSSHTISMDKSCSMFVSVYSSIKEAPSCGVFRLNKTPDHRVLPTQIGKLLEASVSDYTPPEMYHYPSASGFTMYGLVYKPPDFNPSKKYPTLVFVYAGPQVQLVSNSYKGMRFLRLHTLAALGYIVIVQDSRGSCHRGLKFESHIRHRLGQAEVEDQVEGLQWLASTGGYIDLTRVAIHGWSYGGYISLMALCQRPDVFKLAIAGAPVTSWELYDTGYTERYMGLPTTNSEGYSTGSVLKQVNRFPSEENRLLIVHGLIDENVHFYHTSALINALVKACKPYDLQVYPNERHGIRNPDANEHYEAMLVSYMQQHL